MDRIVFIALFMLVFSGNGFAQQQAALRNRRAELSDQGEVKDVRYKPDWTQFSDGELVLHSISANGTRYLRLQFDNIKDLGNEAFTVVVIDAAGNEVLNYSRAAFTASKSFWTPTINGDRAEVQVLANTMPTRLTFEVNYALWEPAPQVRRTERSLR